MRYKDTPTLREMFQYHCSRSLLDQCKIATQDNSRHGLVKMDHSGDNCWCPYEYTCALLKKRWLDCETKTYIQTLLHLFSWGQIFESLWFFTVTFFLWIVYICVASYELVFLTWFFTKHVTIQDWRAVLTMVSSQKHNLPIIVLRVSEITFLCHCLSGWPGKKLPQP